MKLQPKSQRGAVLVMGALMLVVMIGFLGLAIDSGNLFNTRRAAQTAADAAALAAASEVAQGRSANVSAIANAVSEGNGFKHNTSGATVSATLSGSRVEVTVTKITPTYFMRALGGTSSTVSARAAAEVSGGSGGNPACLVVLVSGTGTTAEGALHMNNSNASITSKCDIHVNSGHTSKAIDNKESKITVTAIAPQSPKIRVVGRPSDPSSSNCGNNCYSSRYSPEPTYGSSNVTPLADPLAGVIDSVAKSTCDFNNLNITTNAWTSTQVLTAGKEPTLSSDKKSVTIKPGVYCGGLYLKDSTVQMQPGIYVMLGSNWSSHSLWVEGNINLSGTGVMIYLTGTSALPFGPVYFKGNVTLNLSAATTGQYAGILFFQDRAVGSASNIHLFESLKSPYEATMNGALYFRNSRLRFLDTVLKTSGLYTPIVVNRLDVYGEAKLNVNANYTDAGLPSNYPFRSPPKVVKLIE